MKEIKAFVRPERLNGIHDQLRKAGHCCMTVLEAEGTGRYSDPTQAFPSLKHPFMHMKVIKLEIICKDEDVEDVVGIIHHYGSTNNRGDGIVAVSQLENVYSVRTGEKGEGVL